MCDFGLLAFETAPVGIVLAENRVIRSCNKTFANMLGYHVENLVGQSFRMLYGFVRLNLLEAGRANL